MRNVFLVGALVFILSANASNNTVIIDKVVSTLEQEKEFKKVETIQVPVEVLKQVSTKYSGYALKEAYSSEDGEFKLVLAKENKTVKTYYKRTGEFIKEEA